MMKYYFQLLIFLLVPYSLAAQPPYTFCQKKEMVVCSGVFILGGISGAVASSCCHRSGRQGEIGCSGSRGKRGARGDDGPQGLPGIKGDPGSKGLTGIDVPGLQGATGPAGVKGPQGNKGPAGLKGFKGLQSKTQFIVNKNHKFIFNLQIISPPLSNHVTLTIFVAKPNGETLICPLIAGENDYKIEIIDPICGTYYFALNAINTSLDPLWITLSGTIEVLHKKNSTLHELWNAEAVLLPVGESQTYKSFTDCIIH